MKVILLQDVAKLGRKFAIVEVPDGYGINKLIPKGLAKPASVENVRAVQARAAAHEHDKEAVETRFRTLLASLEGKDVVVPGEANTEGRFFQALKAEKIAAAIKAVSGESIKPAAIVIAEPIKAVGQHTVTITAGALQHPLLITVTAA